MVSHYFSILPVFRNYKTWLLHRYRWYS